MGTRTERTFDDLTVTRMTEVGASIVVHQFGNGESWVRYLVMQRPVTGRPSVLREQMDRWCAPVTPESAYSPTGRAFWREPRIIRRRRFVVVAQSGGLDV